MAEEADDTCLFCYVQHQDRIVAELDTVFAMKDGHPVTEGHHLILPKRHTIDYFTMTPQEREETSALLVLLQQKLLADDSSITGFNIGMNCGESAGQSIFHAHTHLIPRRDGDTKKPKGGIRGVIPDKMGY